MVGSFHVVCRFGLLQYFGGEGRLTQHWAHTQYEPACWVEDEAMRGGVLSMHAFQFAWPSIERKKKWVCVVASQISMQCISPDTCVCACVCMHAWMDASERLPVWFYFS